MISDTIDRLAREILDLIAERDRLQAENDALHRRLAAKEPPVDCDRCTLRQAGAPCCLDRGWVGGTG